MLENRNDFREKLGRLQKGIQGAFGLQNIHLV